MIDPPDAVSGFLWSVRKRADADFFLGLVQAEERSVPPQSQSTGPPSAASLDRPVSRGYIEAEYPASRC